MRVQIALLTLVVVACSQPVIRQEAPKQGAQSYSSVAPTAAGGQSQNLDLPDMKKRLWVLRFVNHPSPSAEFKGVDVAAILHKRLAQRLQEAGVAFLLDEKQEEGARDMDLDSSADLVTIKQMGRGSGSAGFVTGKIIDLKSDDVDVGEGLLRTRTVAMTVTVEYELFDATSGRRLATAKVPEKYEEVRSELNEVLGWGTARLPDLDKKMEKLGDKIADRMIREWTPFAGKMGWSGRIIKTENTRIFINAGQRTGVKMGEVLKIVEEPQPVIDPSNGQRLGEAPGRVKGTIKVISFFGIDGAIAVLQSGAGIRAGDRVELF